MADVCGEEESKVSLDPPSSPVGLDAEDDDVRIVGWHVGEVKEEDIEFQGCDIIVHEEIHDDFACQEAADRRLVAQHGRVAEMRENESNVYVEKAPGGYTSEEWRILYLATPLELYRRSITLMGYVLVDGCKWAICTRFGSLLRPCIRLVDVHEEAARFVSELFRPQFRFLAAVGEEQGCIFAKVYTHESELEKVISGHVDVWGMPVVIDGVPFKPDVELVSPTEYGVGDEVKRDLFGFPAEHLIALGGLPVLLVGLCLGEFFSSCYSVFCAVVKF
jgi:hypothetical protein